MPLIQMLSNFSEASLTCFQVDHQKLYGLTEEGDVYLSSPTGWIVVEDEIKEQLNPNRWVWAATVLRKLPPETLFLTQYFLEELGWS